MEFAMMLYVITVYRCMDGFIGLDFAVTLVLRCKEVILKAGRKS